VRVTCHKGLHDIGPNLAVALLDISEIGARLTTKTILDKGQTVSITLEGREHHRPIKLTATVVRSEEAGEEGLCRLAVLWEKRLVFSEVLKMT
jgi:hypothetical protein